MGTIVPRKRKDGSTASPAQILVKRSGAIVHREAQTFDRKQAAKVWLARRETELRVPGALEKPRDPPLRDVIDQYIETSRRAIGRAGGGVLRTIKTHDIADLPVQRGHECRRCIVRTVFAPSSRRRSRTT